MFLHTGWRSGGTWLWSLCREQPRVHALYEPLHEQLGRLRPSDIRRLRPGSWASNHSETPPYFEEYERLLPSGRRGVPGYLPRFAYERFFLGPETEDPELEAYLQSLLAAAAPGQVSVLKFCRSLGRVGWLQHRFPDALHSVVMRDPVAQWASAQRLLTVQRNRYFVIAPLLVLARNATHPLVRDAADALDVRLPQLHSTDIAYGIEACWRHLRRVGDEDRYRGFLAFWTACGIQALHSGAQIIDARKAAMDTAYRQAIEAAFASKLGQDIELRSRVTAAPHHAPWMDAAHKAAAGLVRTHQGMITPDRLGHLLGYLAHNAPACPVRLAGPMRTAHDPRPPRTAAQRMVTWLAVLLARALQPVRRLNGAITRPRSQIT